MLWQALKQIPQQLAVLHEKTSNAEEVEDGKCILKATNLMMKVVQLKYRSVISAGQGQKVLWCIMGGEVNSLLVNLI